jgi:hypothetical protein
MQPTTKTPATTPRPNVSHKGSITGFVLALLSLVSAGIANALVHAKYTPNGPTTGSVDREVGHAVATGATTTLGALFGMLFIVGAIILAIVALVFIVIRLRNVKVGGLVFSLVSGAIAVWSFVIAAGALEFISAKPVG